MVTHAQRDFSDVQKLYKYINRKIVSFALYFANMDANSHKLCLFLFPKNPFNFATQYCRTLIFQT